MARKSLKQYFKYELELIKYQWESLRTNPEYIKDCNRYNKLLSKPKCDYNRFLPKMEYFFKKKYGIEPLDLSVPFPDTSPIIPKNRKQTEEELHQFILWLYFVDLLKAVHCLSPEWERAKRDKFRKNQAYNLPLTTEEIKRQHSIAVLVTLDAPLPKIIKEFTEIVQDWKEKRHLALGRKPTSIRHRLDEYRSYFKVYKLVKHGLKWETIAKKCYPGDAERDINYAKIKVKRDYERWQKIGMLFKQHPLLAYRMSFTFSPNPPELLTNKEYYRYFQKHCKKARNT